MAYRIVGKFGNYTWLCLVQLLLAIHIAQCGLWIVYSIDLSTLAFALCGQLQLSYNRSAGTSELVLVFSSMNTQMHDSYMQSEPMASCSFHTTLQGPQSIGIYQYS